MKKLLWILSFIGLAGCASHPNHITEVKVESKNKNYENHFVPMFKEKKPARELAEITLKSADLTQLTKRGLKSFTVAVYPKISQLTMTSNVPNDPLKVYGKPKDYEVKTGFVGKCKSLLAENSQLFSSYNVKSVFDSELENTEKNCAIIHVKDLQYENLNADLIKKGDFLKMSIYIDEDWKVYGYNIEEFTGQYKKTITKSIKLDERYNMSSGLTRFPVDLPMLVSNPDLSGLKNANLDEVISSKNVKLPLPKVTNCKAVVIQFKDYFGQDVETTKCENLPWPSVIENSKFLAITII